MTRKIVLLALALLLAACGGTATQLSQPPAATMPDAPSQAALPSPTTTESAVALTAVPPTATSQAPPTTTARAWPAWMTTPVRDVRTGETFTIAQLVEQGDTVLLQLMAVW